MFFYNPNSNNSRLDLRGETYLNIFLNDTLGLGRLFYFQVKGGGNHGGRDYRIGKRC